MRHLDLNTPDFDSLCAEVFNEEQFIKRNEVQSNINRGSALMTEKGKRRGYRPIRVNRTRERQADNVGNVITIKRITIRGMNVLRTLRARTLRVTITPRKAVQAPLR